MWVQSRDARPRRRRAVVVVVAAIGVAAAALVITAGNDGGAGDATTSTSTSLVAPSSTAARSDAPTCRPIDVFVTERALDSVEPGRGQAEIVMTNVGAAPCQLVSELDLQAAVFAAPAPGSPRPATGIADRAVTRAATGEVVAPEIAPGESVAIWLRWDAPPEVAAGTELASAFAIGALGDALVDRTEDPIPFGSLEYLAPVATDFEGPVGLAMFEPAGPPADANPVDPTDVASIRGVGAVRVGMTLQEVADATGQRVVVTEYGETSGGCGYAFIGGVESVSVPVFDQQLSANPQLARVAGLILGPGYRTSSGVGAGSTLREVLDAWGERATEFDLGGRYVEFTPIDAGDDQYRAFAIIEDPTDGIVDDDRVAELVVGFPHARRDQRCG